VGDDVLEGDLIDPEPALTVVDAFLRPFAGPVKTNIRARNVFVRGCTMVKCAACVCVCVAGRRIERGQVTH
jgi:hypothetical protein